MMPKFDISADGEGWTYGAEHELIDWDTRKGLPSGFSRSDDYTMVNSSGIAVQPDPRDYPFGGEINTPPTENIVQQTACLTRILNMHPNATVNYRSNLHIHIRVPGLRYSLERLKQLQRFIHEQLPNVIDKIEPLPTGGKTLAEKKRQRRCKQSHHTFLTRERWEKQLQATNPLEFFKREVIVNRHGQLAWQLQPRACVNLRQLLQTDTIEFRHFPGTIHQHELFTALDWCREFLLCAFRQDNLWMLYKHRFANRRFPKFAPFNEQLEITYQATSDQNGCYPIRKVRENIRLIEQGRFHGSVAEEEAQKRARGLSRKHL